MSNSTNNPPPFDSQQPKGPWVYSGISQPVTPPASPTPPSSTPTPPSTPATPASPAAKPAASVSKSPIAPVSKNDDASLASIIDTIEAIIIALVLALTFRAFIVEAFVIPTGSMAPTLLGAHFNVICPNCGYSFTRDANLHFQLDKVRVAGRDKDVIRDFGARAELRSNRTIPCDGEPPSLLLCPNCEHVIPYESLPQYLAKQSKQEVMDGRPGQGPRFVPFAWANNGDRILVLKYIYSVFEPKRWDVIVFKEPMLAQDNFIKRLIGLPGETVEIINGDIFTTPAGGDPTNLRERVIARKPPHIQKNLWQLVYDNDFYPMDENKPRRRPDDSGNIPADYFENWRNPWQGRGATAESWKIGSRPVPPGPTRGPNPVLQYESESPGTLEFALRDAYTYNILGYNNDMLEVPSQRFSTLFPMGDLHLEAVWTPAQSGGTSIQLSLGSKRNCFRVTWAGAGLTLDKYDLTSKQWAPVKPDWVSPVAAPRAGQAYHVEFNNVDHAVQFMVDGKMVLEQQTAWTAADARREAEELQDALKREDASSFSPAISIQVGGRCTIGHLKLMRDLYYTEAPSPRTANMGNPLTLGKDEFFPLGDNSRRSHDGRSWPTVYPALDDLGTRRGIVPRRYLLGKAFFVYWPAGYRLTRAEQGIDVPLVPNTGEMRFIR